MIGNLNLGRNMTPFSVKTFISFALLLCAARTISVQSTENTVLSTCTQDQLLAHSPNEDETTAHRQFTLPVVEHPFGTQLGGVWGFGLSVRVDKSGRVVCYTVRDRLGEPQQLNERQREAIKEVGNWHYSPFLDRGQPAPAIVEERIREQERPEKRLPMPVVEPEEIHIALERTACFGTCPVYKVDVYGDGRVIYQGTAFVNVLGKHAYTVPPETVAHLVDTLRANDLWSLRPVYESSITDQPHQFLTLELGREVHRISDYAGEMVGMPASVSNFEEEVDNVARSRMWLHLSKETVAHLEAEHFDFSSRAAADLFARAVKDEAMHDDDALLDLIRLGAPIDARYADFSSIPPLPVIENALLNRRAKLIDPLINKGALNSSGRPSQQKIDAAFLAAIRGGSLELVQRIWAIAGSNPHPSLTFDSVTRNGRPVHKRAPVTLAWEPWGDEKQPDRLEIVKWLAAMGCDLKASAADGNTILHRAATAGNTQLVRFLLAQGIDVSTPGAFGYPPLMSTSDEEVAMILLEAGAAPRGNKWERTLRDDAENMRWPRVIAWLDAHRW